MTALETEIRDRYVRAAWTHKTHEKEADRNWWWYRFFQWSEIVVSTVAGTSGIVYLFCKEYWGIVSAACATFLMVFDHVKRQFSFEKATYEHRKTATALLRVREGFLGLISELHTPGFDPAVIRAQQERLVADWCQILETAPRTSRKAYDLATKVLHGTEQCCVDSEIDNTLPPGFQTQKGE